MSKIDEEMITEANFNKTVTWAIDAEDRIRIREGKRPYSAKDRIDRAEEMIEQNSYCFFDGQF